MTNKTLLNKILIGALIFSFAECMNSGALMSTEQPAQISSVPSAEEFAKLIQGNDFLKQLNDIGPVTKSEKWQIELAIKDQNTTYTPKINRSLEDFKGEELVIGGGKKKGKYRDNRGKTMIQPYLDDLEKLRQGEYKFDPFGSVKGPLTEETRNLAISNFQEKLLDPVLNKYYTINYDETTEPDLVTSATDINGIMENLPKGRFDRIHYENVNTFVFLNPNAWKIMEYLCKKGGTITINAGVHGMRLLPIILKDTKWEQQVQSQLKKKYDYFKSDGGFTLILKN
ncbi:MAG: hypothetical protein ABFQ95_02155 [Pseudomonadota bacterium]